METDQFQAALAMLQTPVLPLVRIIQLLYLTGPFNTVSEIMQELNEPIETNACFYENPPVLLAPYLEILEEFQLLKDPHPLPYIIVDPEDNPLEFMECLDLQISQKVLSQELETINSLLCAPCGCTLCCTGPEATAQQSFFEIPLSKHEIDHFSIPRIDTETCHAMAPYSDPPLEVEGQPFFDRSPSIYHWRTGWSMILPKSASCPKLLIDGRCAIYPQRPNVCRRPQIFPYILEPTFTIDQKERFVHQGKVLAIWDCPYVKQFKDEIAAYAEHCELEPVFKENKA